MFNFSFISGLNIYVDSGCFISADFLIVVDISFIKASNVRSKRQQMNFIDVFLFFVSVHYISALHGQSQPIITFYY